MDIFFGYRARRPRSDPRAAYGRDSARPVTGPTTAAFHARARLIRSLAPRLAPTPAPRSTPATMLPIAAPVCVLTRTAPIGPTAPRAPASLAPLDRNKTRGHRGRRAGLRAVASHRSGVSPDAAHLLPRSSSSSTVGASPRAVVAEIAAKPPAPPPAVVANDNAFYAFCRANWPAFVVVQTCALTGAVVSGVSSRKKRIELELIMKKYRRMMDRVDDMTCTFDWDLGMEQCTDDWPGSTELAIAKMLLDDNGDADAALVKFAEAKAAVVKATDGLRNLTGDAKATSSWVSAGKGAALALVSKGTEETLRAAVEELKTVAAAAEREGDSTVYGMLGDVLTDLGDYAAAGEYYDKVLAMD